MIKFKKILKENPDTVYYKGKSYMYTSPANKCAFFIYRDDKSAKKSVFGYSNVKKAFYSDDPEVLKDLSEAENSEELKYDSGENELYQLKYWSQQSIKRIKSNNNGGGHMSLESVLKGLDERMDRYDDPIIRGRIFEVDNIKNKPSEDSGLQIESTIPSGKAIILTFWNYDKDDVTPYKNQYEKVLEFNGYDPKECLYEIGSTIMSYNEMYDIQSTEPQAVTTAATTDDNSLEKVIDDKSRQFVDKRGQLHTTGAKLTPSEKQNLENEVDALEIEIKILNDLLTSGEKYYTDSIKNIVNIAVQRKLHANKKEKLDRYSLIAQAEKQYGMPIAQIRQKYKDIPLDQLVKKESVYKKLWRMLR